MVGVEQPGLPGCDMHVDEPYLADASASALRFPAPGEPPAGAGIEAADSTAAAAVVAAAVVVWSPRGGDTAAESSGGGSGLGPRRPGVEHADEDDDDEEGDGRPAAGAGAAGTLRLPPALRGRPIAPRQDHHPMHHHHHQQHHEQQRRSAAVQRRSALEGGWGSDSEAGDGRRGCATAAARCRSSTPPVDVEAVAPSSSFVQQASQAIERLDVGGRLTLGSAATHGSAWPGTATTSPPRARLVRQRSVGLTRKRLLV